MTTLVTLRPGVTFAPAAAASWARMEADRGRPLDVNRSYASWDEQMEKYEAYQAYRAGRGPWAPLALHPSQSWHCIGRAADTDDDEWIRAHPQYGWRFVVLSEKWHAQHYPELDLTRNRPASGDNTTPLVTPRKDEEDMLFITYKDAAGDRLYVRVGFDDAIRETKAEAVAWNAATGQRHKEVTRGQAHLILEGVRAARARRNGMIADTVTAQLDALLADLGDVPAEAVPDDDA